VSIAKSKSFKIIEKIGALKFKPSRERKIISKNGTFPKKLIKNLLCCLFNPLTERAVFDTI